MGFSTEQLNAKAPSLSPAGIRAQANTPWKPGEWREVPTGKSLDQFVKEQTQTGRKDDSEKSRVDLIDAEFLEGLGDVLRFGANKYNPQNWRGGISYSRLLGACFRHLLALLRGEDVDKESGLGHVFHLACSCMFLSWHLKHRKDLDDRYRPSPSLNPNRIGLVNMAPVRSSVEDERVCCQSGH